MPFVMSFSGYMKSLIPSYNRARKFVSEDSNAKRTGRALSIPLVAIYPLLQEFVVVYRELMLLAMVNAFGWASSPPHLACCATTKPAKVLYITLSITPSISTSTETKSAFRIENAEAITLETFRDAATNRRHHLYQAENQQLIQGYDSYVAQHQNSQGCTRISMCVIRLDFNNGIRPFMYFKYSYYADDPMRDYSAQWNPVNWLLYLKTMVAKGKGWHRDDVNFD